MPDSMSVDANKPSPDQPISNQQYQQQQHSGHGSDESIASSPERDTLPSLPNSSNGTAGHLINGQQPKRKGGRKPIYATSEERKQRNRQAQAAFRERRTEYIKQLEETIRVHENNLYNLQTAHRAAADECLMLRYKNSLLERILLEKGIDVQAELRAKTGSPNLGPTHMPPNLIQPPPIQRALMSRHHQRRPNPSIAPKSGISQPQPQLPPLCVSTLPKGRPTPSSHSASPTDGTYSPVNSDNMSTRGPASTSRQQMPPIAAAQPQRQQRPVRPGPRSQHIASGSAHSLYPAPAFQSHIEQLEQEYSTQTDLVDDAEVGTPNAPYPPSFNNDGNQLLSPASNGPRHHMHQPQEPSNPQQVPHQQYPPMAHLADQNLDWDPFGLGASMAFPSSQPYPIDQSSMR